MESAGRAQPVGPAANTGQMGSRFETEAWSVQRALTEAVNLAFDPLGSALASLPARIVETGLVVARVAGHIADVYPAGGTEERGPPQGPSSPASNLPSGNALSGASSSGGGFEPLLVVLALILIAAALRGRFWPTYEHSRPGLVPRLIPERPG